MSVLSDFWEHAYYFFKEPNEYDKEIVNKHFTTETSEQLKEIINFLKNHKDWNHKSIEDALKQHLNQKGISQYSKIFNILRVAFTGSNKGIGIAEIISILEAKETISRIEKFIITVSGNYE